MARCPACGFDGPGESECARCGVVFAKWRARRQAPQVASPTLPRRRRFWPAPDRWLRAFFEQTSRLFASGLPITEALALAGAHAPRRVARALATVAEQLKDGATLGDALRAAAFLDPTAITTLEAAERAGDLPAALDRLATDIGRRFAFRRSVVMGLAYPAILVVLAIFALPLKMLVFEGMNAYLAKTLPALAIVVGTVVFLLAGLPRLLALMGAPDAVRDIVAALPVVGAPWRSARLIRFTRTLGRFLDAGLPLHEALDVAAAATGNASTRRRVTEACRALAGGATFTEALRSTGMFGPAFLLAIEGAERSGRLGETLLGIAESIEAESLHRIRLTILIGTTFATVAVMALVAYQLFLQYSGTVKSIEGAIDEVLKGAGDIDMKKGLDSLKDLDKLIEAQ